MLARGPSAPKPAHPLADEHHTDQEQVRANHCGVAGDEPLAETVQRLTNAPRTNASDGVMPSTLAIPPETSSSLSAFDRDRH